MKKLLRVKSVLLSLLSAGILAFFVIIATGSLDDLFFIYGITQTWDYSDDGVYKRVTETANTSNTYTGERDPQGRWDGPLVIEEAIIVDESGNTEVFSTETVTMVEGMRHGRSVTTYKDKPDAEVCYQMGHVVDCQKSASAISSDAIAYQHLASQYPWYINSLYPYGFDDDFIQAYLDTLEMMILSYPFNEEEFEDYYQFALDSLAGTAYDTIMDVHSILNILLALEEIKNAEFRLAVIDQSRMAGTTMYQVIQTKYPGYLQFMNMVGVSSLDFEAFCEKFDSIMNSYGSLDLEDPYFVDSVDVRMFYTLEFISSEEDTTGLKSASLMATTFDVSHLPGNIRVESYEAPETTDAISTSAEIAEFVLFTILEYFIQADIINRALSYAYSLHHAIIRTPITSTEYLVGISATSVELGGYVIDDGGADITARGIAWSTHYNPTIGDQTIPSGTGTGRYTVTVDGLTEGTAYYARSYATNSAGMAYGNCISFVPVSTSGIVENTGSTMEMSVYPNPASALVTVGFMAESPETMMLFIVDIKGQIVYQEHLDHLHPGNNQLQVDVSGFCDGVYFCQMTQNGQIKAKQKLVISH